MKLNLEIIGGPTWILTVDNSLKIGCDPALAPEGTRYAYKGLSTSRVKPAVYNDASFTNVSLWLITHDHFDHIDKAGVEKIEQGASVISRVECAKHFKKRDDLALSYLEWEQQKRIHFGEYAVEVRALAAYHGTNFFSRFLMGKVSGYLLTISKGAEKKTIYVTSDTVYSEDIVQSLENVNVDYIIANMGNIMPRMFGGPFIMNTDMLLRFEERLMPQKTIPIHIDDYSHFNSTPEEVGQRFDVPASGTTLSL